MTLNNNDKDRFLNELIDYLSIPSVSTDDAFKDEIIKAAHFTKDAFIEAGAEETRVVETKGHPIVVAHSSTDDNLPRVLVYGHYDVQPADPIELWDQDPFLPVVKNGRVVARGSADDKGQVYMHIKALEYLKKNNIPHNILFLIEGEEEIGSPNLAPFIIDNNDVLACDIILVSDTSMISPQNPSITTSIRGLSYLEIKVTGPNRDLHSGTYGGAVANPAIELSKILAQLKDERGRVTIPGFYDDVIELSQVERGKLNARPFDLSHYKKDLDIKEVTGEASYTTLERTGIRPSLDINGIWSGYTGKGSKTVLPSIAQAKVSMRLVANQNHEDITRKAKTYITSLAPRTVKIKVEEHHGAQPAMMSVDNFGYRIADKAFQDVWGKRPLPTYEGGSLPIVSLLQEQLTEDVVLMGFGLDEDRIHSPNESFSLEMFYKGIETIIAFYNNLFISIKTNNE